MTKSQALAPLLMAVVSGVSLNLTTGAGTTDFDSLKMDLGDYGSGTVTYYEAKGGNQVEDDYLRHFGDIVGG